MPRTIALPAASTGSGRSTTTGQHLARARDRRLPRPRPPCRCRRRRSTRPHARPVWADLHPQRPAERLDACLAHSVGVQQRRRDRRGDRGDREQVAASLDHVGQGRPQGPPDPQQVHLEHALEVGRRSIRGHRGRGTDDAGAGDRRVDAAEALHASGNRLVERAGIRHVGDQPERANARARSPRPAGRGPAGPRSSPDRQACGRRRRRSRAPRR